MNYEQMWNENKKYLSELHEELKSKCDSIDKEQHPISTYDADICAQECIVKDIVKNINKIESENSGISFYNVSYAQALKDHKRELNLKIDKCALELRRFNERSIIYRLLHNKEYKELKEQHKIFITALIELINTESSLIERNKEENDNE